MLFQAFIIQLDTVDGSRISNISFSIIFFNEHNVK